MNVVPKVIWENENMLVIDKPAGLVVHPDFEGTHKITLVDWLVKKYPEIQKEDWEYPYRPGIVHRLDKDTSGLLMIAKNRKVFEDLKNQIKNREVEKRYLVLVKGRLEGEDIIAASIARKLSDRKKMTTGLGKEAVTKYRVLRHYKKGNNVYSFCDAQIITGRTHQIRVHFKYIGHPVVGDRLYAKGRDRREWENLKAGRQFLHAYFLKFREPLTRKMRTIKIELSSDLKVLLANLEKVS